MPPILISIRLLSSAALAALLLAPNALFAGQPATQTQSDPHAFDALIQMLGNPAFDVRQRAQLLLDQIPLTQRDALVQAAEKTADEEIKARLRQHVDLMDEIIATDPPPISLDVKDASPSELEAALRKATGTSFNVTLPDSSRYTLKAIDQPFWEVLRQLSLQHPISLAPPDGTSLFAHTYRYIRTFRGFSFMTSGAYLLPDGTVSLTLNAAIDPRVNLIELQPMRIQAARDEQNRMLQVLPDVARPGTVVNHMTTRNPPHFQYCEVAFNSADTHPKSISVKGTLSALMPLAQKSFEIDDVAKHLNQRVDCGDTAVIVRDFLRGGPGVARTGIAIQLVPKALANPPVNVPKIELTANGYTTNGDALNATETVIIDYESSSGGAFTGIPKNVDKMRIVVTDAKGKRVANYFLPHGIVMTGVHIISSDFQEPLKFTISIPTLTRQVDIPFEFKDLPLTP